MTDSENVENHTIRLLQEMRAEMREMRAEVHEVRAEQSQFRQEMTGFKQEMTEFRQETERRFDGMDRRFDTLEQRVGVIEPAVLKVIDAVTAIAKTQDQQTTLLMTHSEKLTEIQRAQNVMEKDMRGIRGRVERIEDHIGLVV